MKLYSFPEIVAIVTLIIVIMSGTIDKNNTNQSLGWNGDHTSTLKLM